MNTLLDSVLTILKKKGPVSTPVTDPIPDSDNVTDPVPVTDAVPATAPGPVIVLDYDLATTSVPVRYCIYSHYCSG